MALQFQLVKIVQPFLVRTRKFTSLTFFIAKEAGMIHLWKEVLFNTAAFIEDEDGRLYQTCTHVLKCIACDKIIGLSEIPKERIPVDKFPEINGCPGTTMLLKRQEIKEKTAEIKQPDYPAKKYAKGGRYNGMSSRRM